MKWPLWNREAEPGALRRYLQPERIAQLVPLPGTSAASPEQRLAEVWRTLAGCGVSYAYEAPPFDGTRQAIRTPDEILRFPRHATCLDLAVLLSGASLRAGLRPVIAVLAPAQPGPSHSIVIVWVGQRPFPWDSPLWVTAPPGLADRLRGPKNATGELIAIDPQGLSREFGGTAAPLSFEDSRARATGLLTQGEWRWEIGIDVGGTYHAADALPCIEAPSKEPLHVGYDSPSLARSPLSLIRPQFGVVPFQATDEFDVLEDWVQIPCDWPRLAVAHGVGGAGKTRLVLELATRLSQRGWYAGMLGRTRDTAWLGSVTSPLMVGVDYADSLPLADLVSVVSPLMGRRDAPTAVVLTARGTGPWWSDLLSRLNRDRQHPHTKELRVPRVSERAQRQVARTALQAFRRAQDGNPKAVLDLPNRKDWTTLDLVLLAWLAARKGSELSATRAALYGEVLQHERRYWVDSFARFHRAMPRGVLDAAAALTTLANPVGPRVDSILQVEPTLRQDAVLRSEVQEVLVDCLSPAPDAGLALQPDPVGDHLVVEVMSARPDLLVDLLRQLEPSQRRDALANLNRAGGESPEAVATIIATSIASLPELWREAHEIGAAQGGPVLAGLADAVRDPAVALPFAEVASACPAGHALLRNLALAATERDHAEQERLGHPAPERLAGPLNDLAIRQWEAGQRESALASITRAVEIYEGLARENPAAFLPYLAASLNNLANMQSEARHREAALASITRAVEIREGLARENPAAFLPDLAMSLNNLANMQSAAGRREAALASITRAVEIREGLARENPAAFLPGLAGSLNSLAAIQSAAGQREPALASITRAVEIHEGLAREKPAAFLPALALSLNSLSAMQSGAGQREPALASIARAVEIHEGLARENPAAFLPDLAMSLNNLANMQSEAGQREAALASITRAVEIHERLTRENPAAFLPDLAMSLNNLANMQSAAGQRAPALASIGRAVGHYEQLARESPAAFLPYLAASLNNLATMQSEAGQREAALASITRAVELREGLARENPAAFLPDLAGSLNNLAATQSEAGQREAALASITRAVEIYEGLARENPAAFLPGLATSLNSLANRQSGAGQREAALASITRAVEIHEGLARENHAAFLPALALSLNSLSAMQSGAGQREPALASITRAVEIYEGLARENHAAFLPDLAMSLNNLATMRFEAGQRGAALASITRAVEIREGLARENPAAFLPGLATSLNSLANVQSGAGQREAALASITRAVEIYEGLARENHAAFLPDLALSLNSLSVVQSAAGQRVAALASVARAVEIYEGLARENHAAFLPNLAMSLNNLATMRFEAGQREAALASIIRAVEIREGLARANPAASLPDLAMSLNNLARLRCEAGQREAALASIIRAVEIREGLAREYPAAFLPDLAVSLNDLAEMQSEAGTTVFDSVIERLTEPLARSFVRVGRARRRLAIGDLAGARVDVLDAVTEASGPIDNPHLGRLARQAVRDAAQECRIDASAEIPDWVTGPLPDSALDLLNAWNQQGQWAAEEAFITEHQSELVSRDFLAALRVLSGLHPGDRALEVRIAQVSAFLTDGLESSLVQLRSAHERHELVQQWIATRTWDASLLFLQAHRDTLLDEATEAAVLHSGADEAVVLQHIAIIRLSRRGVAVDDLIDLARDPEVAAKHALAAIERGDDQSLKLVLTTNPAALQVPFQGQLVHCGLLLLGGKIDEAAKIAADLGGGQVQRQAAAVRFRKLAAARPDLAAIAIRIAEALSA